jgi:TRAP transporter TAXI family solute receptor
MGSRKMQDINKEAITMKKALIGCLLSIFIITVSGHVGAATKEKTEIQIYSAKFGGVNYLAGLTLAELLNKNHPWLRATNLETTGAQENTKKDYDDLKQRAKTLRLGVGHVYWEAKNGRAPLFTQKYEGMKLILTFAVSLSGLVATSNPNIHEPKDLIGKRVGIGEKGSAFLVESQFLFRDCWGILDKIRPEYLDFKGARDAFMDGLIDAVFCSGQLPAKGKYVMHPLMQEALRLKKGLHFVNITKEDLARGSKISGWPIAGMNVPVGAFAPNIPARELMVYNTHLMLWAYADVNEEIVYETVKMAHENISKFGEANVAMKIMSEGAFAWLPASSLDEVHPGALKYYKEKGIKVLIGESRPQL